jgi:outer membrane murein-binding lipoprotein Lpp
MKTTKIFTVFGAVVVSTALLAGCRAEEQGRITQYQPGVYLGKKDTELSSAQVRDLRVRSAFQGDAVRRTVGGGARKPDVRKPGVSGRTKKQGNPY